ncbi:orphan sodium- and chloride-dependent neurotransmitter transporter NTT5 isoform X2 [Rousettus aegyptiacus]|uniref:orphan sodium- and chloride-dependent neurotransmitter transporter NTT5 isoform X2 n=1 Tax=Rousettus aegyptiacus TaxID=9407 RepID=UPI00168D0A9B|nr:orphan sodium- and chloride-dependent neurotransmitter transporter NTT5 isoform X2 [Rousettus aegyptiacus]
MKSLENKLEEEVPPKPATSTSPPWNPMTKTQYFSQMKRNENILIQVAFSMGLGSMWRFPYLCLQNGGGTFILIYFFMLLLFGIPLLYMELIMGQWLRLDNIRVWKHLMPWLGGIGYSSILVCMLMSLSNSIIIAWSLSYLGHSFHHPLPWSQCPLLKNISVTDLSCLQTMSHQYFWYHSILYASGRIDEGIQVLVLKLAMGIFAAWSLLVLTMIMGLKISMPILVFLVFLPFVILLCLLIRGFFLEGAVIGLRRMVTTELSAWASLDLWRQAGGHVLYSLGLGMGVIINISYKAGSNNYAQVASLLATVNLVTSLLATSIIFMVLGFWTTTSGHACIKKSISEMMDLINKGLLPQDAEPPKDILLQPSPSLVYLDWINSLPGHLKYQVIHFSPSCSIKAQKEQFMQGPGLAFAAFSQAVSLLPGGSFWAIIFFLTLCIMELRTFTIVSEGIIFPLQNCMSIFRNHLSLLSVVVCLGGFLGSIIFTSHAGSYIMSLFHENLVPLILVVIVAFQNMGLACVYGAKRFREEMYGELGHLIWSFYTFLWCYVTLPGLLALLTLFLIHLYQRMPPHYVAWNSSMSQEVKEPYPESALGWATFLSVLTFLPVPVHSLHHRWFLRDHTVTNPFGKLLNKKTPVVPRTSLPWPKHPLRTWNVAPQDRSRENAGKRFSMTPLRKLSLPWSMQSQSSSWFSLPLISSLTSAFSTRSAITPSRKQVSPAAMTLGGKNLAQQIKEESSEDICQETSDTAHSSNEQSHPVPGEGADVPLATEISGSEETEGEESEGDSPSNR